MRSRSSWKHWCTWLFTCHWVNGIYWTMSIVIDQFLLGEIFHVDIEYDSGLLEFPDVSHVLHRYSMIITRELLVNHGVMTRMSDSYLIKHSLESKWQHEKPSEDLTHDSGIIIYETNFLIPTLSWKWFTGTPIRIVLCHKEFPNSDSGIHLLLQDVSFFFFSFSLI